MSGAPPSTSKESKGPIKITSENVFKGDANIRAARRARLKSLTEIKEIEDFFQKCKNKRLNSKNITSRDWFRDGDLVGVIGVYNTQTYEPKNNVKTATEAVATFVNKEPTTDHVTHEFISGLEVDGLPDEVIKGFYIPPKKLKQITVDNTIKDEIKPGEWYKIKWADLCVEFNNIKNIPDDKIRKQMYRYVRLNHPDIYPQITNSNRPASNSVQQNISDRPSTSKVSQITDQDTTSSETSSPSSDIESSTTERVSKSKGQTLKHKTKKDKVSKTKDKHLKSKLETSKYKKHKKSKFIEKDLKHKHKSSKYTAKPNTKSLVSKKESHKSRSTKQLQINPSQMDSGAAQDNPLVDEGNSSFEQNLSIFEVKSTGKPSDDVISSIDNISGGSNNKGSSLAPSALGVEPPILDASESPENSLQDDNTLDGSSDEETGKNQDNPEKRNQSMTKLTKSQFTQKVANKAMESLKQKLSSYFALALSVFHHKECPKVSTEKAELLFLVIMAHYVESSKTDYKVVTRLLAYEQIYGSDESIIELSTSKHFLQETIKNYDLESKYLVIVSREHLKSIFSVNNHHKWLQCYNEVLDSSLTNLITSPPKPTVEISQYSTELCQNSKRLFEPTKIAQKQYLDKLKLNFVPRILKFASHIEYYVSLNNLTTIWFLCRNYLKNQTFPDNSWSVHFDSVCTDNLKKLEPIQLTACLLSPFDFSKWMDESASGNFKFNDEHYKKIKIELEEFAPKMPVGHEVANDDDQQDDVESLMERPGYRQKLIKDDLIRVLPKDESKSKSSNDPKENESILDEVDRYKEKIKDETMWGDLTQFQFWEWQKNNFPKLSQAAMFYMSVPASVLPSVLLLKKTLKKAEEVKTNKGSIEERLFAIFNDECAADATRNNENEESQGEYSGGAEKRQRLEE